MMNPLTNSSDSSVPSFVMIYCVGGVTYEEERAVQQFVAEGKKNNKNFPIDQVVLGGNSVLNSGTLVKQLLAETELYGKKDLHEGEQTGLLKKLD